MVFCSVAIPLARRSPGKARDINMVEIGMAAMFLEGNMDRLMIEIEDQNNCLGILRIYVTQEPDTAWPAVLIPLTSCAYHGYLGG